MRELLLLLAVIGFSLELSSKSPEQASARETLSVDDIAGRLADYGNYQTSAQFIVSMPRLPDDVIYNVDLYQIATLQPDSLSPANYLIDWTMEREDKDPVKGFSAYFSGNHYRLNSNKFQEYHHDNSSAPFEPLNGGVKKGVHRTAQFVNLLPAMIAEDLRTAAADSAYSFVIHPDTIVGGQKVIGLDMVLTVRGTTASEAEYIFDKATFTPLRIHIENNPGSISEQTVDVKYSPVSDPILPLETVLSEPLLIDLYPEPFTTMRKSLFRIESLLGKKTPAFEAPMLISAMSGKLSDERYVHGFNDSFFLPTIIVIMDGDTGFTASTVKEVREAINQLPFSAAIIWVFVDNHVDTISQIMQTNGSDTGSETVLIGASAMARDCGVTAYPSFLVVDKNGIITDVTSGYNKNLTKNVIQKMTFAASRQ